MASTATTATPPPTGPTKKAEDLQLPGPPSGAGGGAPSTATGCVPKFGAMTKFQSPRLYFAGLTPRTKASLGPDDHTEALRGMRGLFPEVGREGGRGWREWVGKVGREGGSKHFLCINSEPFLFSRRGRERGRFTTKKKEGADKCNASTHAWYKSLPSPQNQNTHSLTIPTLPPSSSSKQAQDSDMVPFIRVCKGVVKEASKMYGDCLTWRSTMLPVSKESCLPVLQRGMFFFHGEDKEGRPVGYLTMRGHDPKTRDLDQCLRAIIYQCEALIASKGGKEFQVRSFICIYYNLFIYSF